MKKRRPPVPSLGSLFSGCGGLDLGLEAAGFRCAWQVENDPACNRVLAHRWPDVPRFGDVKEVDPGQLAPVQLLAGGSPCQDLSVAGCRAGLDGERSGLFHEFVRLADALAPRWLLFENVLGLLSSQGGRDFAVVLREFTGFWPAVPDGGWRTGGVCVGPKRWAVWRVLDSQRFGVPQRRRRVYLVAGAGVRPAPEILLEPDCLRGDSAARGEAGEGVAALLAGGSGGRGYRAGADEAAGGQLVARSVMTRGGNRMDAERENYVVAHTLRGEGADASEDGTGRGTPLVAGTLSASYGAQGGNAMGEMEGGLLAFSCKDSGGDAGEVAPTLRAMGHRDSWENGGGQMAVAYQCHGSNVGPMGTLRRGDGGLTSSGIPFIANPVAFDWQSGGDVRLNIADQTSALQASQVPAVAYDMQNGRLAEKCGTIQGEGQATGNRGYGALNAFGVRRLTPRECERLQAYPDDWTRYGADGKELSDSARYRMIGNGVTASVARWIGERILAVDATS